MKKKLKMIYSIIGVFMIIFLAIKNIIYADSMPPPTVLHIEYSPLYYLMIFAIIFLVIIVSTIILIVIYKNNNKENVRERESEDE